MNLYLHSKRLLALGLWLCLLVSLVLSTVPRCRALAAFASDLHAQFTASEAQLACHETDAAQAKEERGTHLENPSLCQCDLLSYLTFTLADFDPQAWIQADLGTESSLAFSLQRLSADFALEPPVPHPKA